MRKHLWILFVLFAFAFVYIRSLTFLYVEGDDAAGISYHVLGRNAAVQPPFSPWQSGLDLVMSVVPANEQTLRTVGILISATSAAVFVLLLIALCHTMLESSIKPPLLFTAGCLLLASPEFFYLGLVYTGSIVAMPLILAAHLLARQAIASTGRFRVVLIVVSAILYGFGSSVRWDTSVYGALIFLDMAFIPRPSGSTTLRPRDRIAIAILWGILAIVLWLGWVYVSGYAVGDIIGVVKLGLETTSARVFTPASFAAMAPLLSPAFVLSALIGLLILLVRQRNLAFWSVAALIPALPWLTVGSPKAFIVSIPSLVLCFTAGLGWFWAAQEKRLRPIKLAFLAAALLIPWIVGVRASYGDEAWGPGFDMKSYDRPKQSGINVSVGIGVGGAAPTQEGPRPLFGHGAVLLGGDWRRLITEIEVERQNAVRYAAERSLPFVIIKEADFHTTANLIQIGYTTNQAMRSLTRNRVARWRVYTKAGAPSVTTYRIENLESVFKSPDDLRLLRETCGDRIVIYGYAPSFVRDAYLRAPHAFEKVDTYTAVVHLDRVSE